jgi:hypothetical protein
MRNKCAIGQRTLAALNSGVRAPVAGRPRRSGTLLALPEQDAATLGAVSPYRRPR